MDDFFQSVSAKITKSPMDTWSITMDVSHSCFRFEYINIFSCSLSGKGGMNLDEVGIDILVRLTVENSCRIQVIHKREEGLMNAIQSLFRIPETSFVCMECATVYADNTQKCPDCLFFKAYAEYKKIEETCSICMTPVYRTQLECGHFFHKTCLLSLDPSNATCPNCRHPISKTFMSDMLEIHDEEDDSEEEQDDEEESSHSQF